MSSPISRRSALLFTGYDFAGNSEQVVSLDTRLRLGSHLVFTGQAARSQADYAKQFNARWDTATRNDSPRGVDLYEPASDREVGVPNAGPRFRFHAILYSARGYRQGVHNFAWKWLPSQHVLKSFGPTLDVHEDWDHTGALQDWIVSPGLAFELTGNTTFTAKRTEALEVFQFLNFRKHSSDFGLTSEISKLVAWKSVMEPARA